MLIATEIKKGDVVTMKFIGGDEVVARLESENTYGNVLEVKKPLVVMIAQQGFGLAPFILTADPDQTINVDKSAIISTVKTIEAVAKEYVKQTTGLVI